MYSSVWPLISVEYWFLANVFNSDALVSGLADDRDGYEYQYDYENRIVKITKDSNDIAEFAYDALGRRIEKKDLVDSNNTRRYYYNNDWQVLSEYDGSGTFKAWYAYGNYIDEVLMRGTSIAPIFTKFYVHDHLYSPAALAAWGGAVIERYEYDAYGRAYILEPNFAADRFQKKSRRQFAGF